MAFAYFTECKTVATTMYDGQIVMAPMMPPVAEQRIAIGNSSVASAPFNGNTSFVLVEVDSTCSLAWSSPNDSAPVAVATKHRMAAGETRFYGVYPGGQVAVIVNT